MIPKLLGGIGVVSVHGAACSLVISSIKDIDQLLSVMRSHFSKLNTTKVLNFLAWEQGRKLYLNYLDKKDNIPNHKNLEDLSVQAQIIAIKKKCK